MKNVHIIVLKFKIYRDNQINSISHISLQLLEQVLWCLTEH